MATSPERVEDHYAAELLMPNDFVKPMVRKYSALSSSVVAEIADVFQCSYTATGFA